MKWWEQRENEPSAAYRERLSGLTDGDLQPLLFDMAAECLGAPDPEMTFVWTCSVLWMETLDDAVRGEVWRIRWAASMLVILCDGFEREARARGRILTAGTVRYMASIRAAAKQLKASS